jgi:heat shock protein 5
VREATAWVNEYGATANAEDFAEQKEKLSGIAHPITSRLYDGGNSGGAGYDQTDVRDEL